MSTADSTMATPCTKEEAERVWSNMGGAEIDVLLQLRSVRWDGYISSKLGRDRLIGSGFAFRFNGFTTITPKGLMLLHALGRLESLTRGTQTLNGR